MKSRWEGERKRRGESEVRVVSFCYGSITAEFAPGTLPPLHTVAPKFQALVYDILPSTTAVFSYRKLSANRQLLCFAGAETIVSSLQTTQIIQDVCFITDHVA